MMTIKALMGRITKESRVGGRGLAPCVARSVAGDEPNLRTRGVFVEAPKTEG